MKAIENSPFTNIFQVGAVVSDAEKTAQEFTSLGLGPFKPLPDNITWTKYRGRTVEAGSIRLATNASGVEFELIQPLEGPSVWQDFLEKKGEGLHHLSFLVDDLDKEEENLVSQGIDIIQHGRTDNGGYCYLKTDKIGGVVFELLQRSKELEIPKVKADGNPFAVLHQVASVVDDVDQTIEYYTALGIGPFKKMKMELTERWLRGTPVQPKPKLFMTQIGNVELEPIQPDESLNIHREFLNQKGEGLHHLGFFRGEEIHNEIEALVKKGAVKSQYGHGPSDAFAYFEPIAGITLELVKRGPQD